MARVDGKPRLVETLSLADEAEEHARKKVKEMVEDIELGMATKEKLYFIRYDDNDGEHFTAHQLQQFSGVARYPIDAWEAAGSPMLTTTGWIKMCMRIAQKNISELHVVFEASQQLDSSAASDIRVPTPPLPPGDAVPERRGLH